MAKTSAGMKALLEEKDRLENTMFRLFEQSEAIRNKIAGIDIAISIIERGDQAPATENQVSATNLKVLLTDLARETGATGINSNTAVELAHKRGIKLLRGSAASNLSRLKNDGVLVHDGKVYRLPEFVRPQPQLILGGKSS
ncbi:hypothetical protein [Bradyrhizobium betae]|uniref:Uncharacterized protein n=1 Tax=Bradyrhizobium betae TaxID=244734 RepID=A0A5P6PBR8_9BRAD|nr:hypothetical protein [Bradyrhizobium betae]MCS3729991.1 hypothetical protein [Bradyrhizobium betae]QFI75817.1 hypothetical protein F8237_27505 [Bradyrhizobium betae]